MTNNTNTPIPAYKATPLQMWEAIVYGALVPTPEQIAYAETDSPLPQQIKMILAASKGE